MMFVLQIDQLQNHTHVMHIQADSQNVDDARGSGFLFLPNILVLFRTFLSM